MDICHELAVTKCEISHVSARLGSCQHLEQSWSGTGLGSQGVTKNRILFIITRIITDTILPTALATSDPGETGGAGALMGNASQLFSTENMSFAAVFLLYSRQLKVTLCFSQTQLEKSV